MTPSLTRASMRRWHSSSYTQSRKQRKVWGSGANATKVRSRGEATALTAAVLRTMIMVIMHGHRGHHHHNRHPCQQDHFVSTTTTP
jgi:hypothetical protein